MLRGPHGSDQRRGGARGAEPLVGPLTSNHHMSGVTDLRGAYTTTPDHFMVPNRHINIGDGSWKEDRHFTIQFFSSS
jgi:hypothetical protein